MNVNSHGARSAPSSAPTTTPERIGSLIAGIASLSVLASFFYDWGFLNALGISFATAPTTVTDHVRSWLTWLPTAVIGFGILAFIELVTQRFELGMTEEEIIEASANPEKTRRQRRRPWRFAIGIAILGLLLFILLGPSFVPASALFIGVMCLWWLTAPWLFGPNKMRQKYPESVRLTIILAPALAFLLFWLGHSAGTTSKRTDANYRIHMSTSDHESVTELNVLRVFEDWVVVHDAESGVTWIRSGDIRRMESLRDAAGFRGLLCVFAPDLCSRITAPGGLQ